MSEALDKMVGYRCIACGWEASADGLVTTCEECGANLDAVYDHEAIRASWSRENLAADPDPSLWRWLPLLPVRNGPGRRSLRVGGTPLVELNHIAGEFGLKRLLVKDDTRLPSGSLKDRASEVAIQHAAEHDRQMLIAASTGNAAASLAALSSWHGVRAVILAPASAPPAKLVQILQHGATLVPIDGSYDEAFDLSVQLAERTGGYTRSTGINPVLAEGKKTVALEIAEQLAWQVPDAVFVPVGDGCIMAGVYKGFADLLALGWIEKLPRLIAVQAEGSCAVVNALESGGEIRPVSAATVADSISVDFPRDGEKALRAVRVSSGFGVRVSDEEILAAQHDLASRTGVFAEPAASAAWAGLKKAAASGQLTEVESAAVLATGSGLKDIEAAQREIQLPQAVAPEVSAVEKAIQTGRRA